MFRMRSLRPSAGLVVGTLALIVATTGAATATVASQPHAAATALKATRLVRVQGPEVVLGLVDSGSDVKHSIAYCPRGSRVVSGGFATVTDAGETFISDGIGTGWWVSAANYSNASPGTVQAYAYCARTGRAITAGAPASAGEDMAVVRQNLAAERKLAGVQRATRP